MYHSATVPVCTWKRLHHLSYESRTYLLGSYTVPAKLTFLIEAHILSLTALCWIAQSHPSLCDSTDHSPPGSSVHGILQARILEWVFIPLPGALLDPGIKPASLMSLALADGFFTTSATWKAQVQQSSNLKKEKKAFKSLTDSVTWKVKVKSLSHVRLFATPWTVAYQALLSMGFSRQEYWSGSPFPSPGDLPDPGIEPRSPALQADALTSESPGKPDSVT